MSKQAAEQARIRARRCAECTHRRDQHVPRVSTEDKVLQWCRDCAAECSFVHPTSTPAPPTDRPGCPRPEKQAHQSRRAAQKEADAVNQRRLGTAVVLGPYRCTCGTWHIGNARPRRRRRKR